MRHGTTMRWVSAHADCLLDTAYCDRKSFPLSPMESVLRQQKHSLAVLDAMGMTGDCYKFRS